MCVCVRVWCQDVCVHVFWPPYTCTYVWQCECICVSVCVCVVLCIPYFSVPQNDKAKLHNLEFCEARQTCLLVIKILKVVLSCRNRKAVLISFRKKKSNNIFAAIYIFFSAIFVGVTDCVRRNVKFCGNVEASGWVVSLVEGDVVCVGCREADDYSGDTLVFLLLHACQS